MALNSLTLTCFKQHFDRTVDLTPGINAIRAPNGSGKSNILLAIGYVLFGSRALPETLEETVSYGETVSKLKVQLTFDYAGVSYCATRGKSGAALTFSIGAGEHRVDGHTDVTKFIEKLFGVSADMASKLMFARQKEVGSALTGGPAVAGKTIETLAGIDLIDYYITLIGEKLAAGNTAAAEGRVNIARERAVAVPVQQFSDEIAAITEETAARNLAEAAHLKLSQQLDTLDVAAANAILADQTATSRLHAQHADQYATLKAALAVEPPVAPEASAIEALREKVAAQKGLAAAEKLHQELKAAKVEVLWDEPMPTLEALIAQTEAGIAGLEEKKLSSTQTEQRVGILLTGVRSEARLQIAKLEGKLVKEESCTFCGKDLKDIPEVALTNNPLIGQIAQVKASLVKSEAELLEAAQFAVAGVALHAAALQEADRLLESLLNVVRRSNSLGTLYARAADFITLDYSVVPALWTWTGPTDAPQDFAGELQELERAATRAVAAGATRKAQEAQLAQALEAMDNANLRLASLEVDEAKETLELAAGLAPQVRVGAELVQTHRDELVRLQADLKTKEALQAQALRQQEQAKAELAEAEAVLAEMQSNNALVKKLRGARPQITDKLWSIVLAATSTYFSQVRGSEYRITRSDNGFKINGNPVSGMSGAEEDILGLAIRLSLTKCFLPNMDFIILDEVAAACDDERETAMLGLLSTVGFDQVILVSHSPLVDAFGDNIITI